MFVLVCIGLLLWLFIYLCISHVSEIIWYLSFSIWFISLSMILSRSIHVVTNGKTSCFFYDLVVFQSTYTLHLPYPFIHLSELSFHISAVVNNTAVHLVVYVSFGHSDGKESACNAGHPGSIPGSGRFPGERNGKPPQYSCLENSVDRGAWSGIQNVQFSTKITRHSRKQEKNSLYTGNKAVNRNYQILELLQKHFKSAI